MKRQFSINNWIFGIWAGFAIFALVCTFPFFMAALAFVVFFGCAWWAALVCADRAIGLLEIAPRFAPEDERSDESKANAEAREILEHGLTVGIGGALRAFIEERIRRRGDL